jgi:hypothetical protein
MIKNLIKRVKTKRGERLCLMLLIKAKAKLQVRGGLEVLKLAVKLRK